MARHFKSEDLEETDRRFIEGKLSLKSSVGESGSFVLKSSTGNGSHSKFAVALSNSIVKIFDIHGKLWDAYEHEKAVTDIKFSAIDPSILFLSTPEGKLFVYDTRCQGPVQTFLDDSDEALKPLLCFDYNLDEQLLCAGTELIREDSFLLFWDRRTSKILGGYWDSHAGDITQINFHPSKSSWMASSSVDGLINVFDLNEKSEEDALMYTFNVESPINTISWVPSDFLSCTTSNEDFQVWSLSDVQRKLCIPRQKFSDYNVNVNYLIDTIKISKNQFLATGTNEGSVTLWYIHKGSLLPVGYLLKGHSDVVRTICYNEVDNMLLTGGDDGCICYWNVGDLKISINGSFSC